jgi:hypothetical protein
VGYIGTCGPMSVLYLMVGGNGWGYIKTFKPMIMLYPMVGKLTGLYKDLWAYGCIVISGREIGKVTYGLASPRVHCNQW